MKKFYREDGEELPSVVYTEEGTQPLGFSPLVDAAEVKVALAALYKKRTADGVDFFNQFRLDLAAAFDSGALTIADAHFIETKLANVKAFLLSGDWATAEYEIQQTSVEGAYTDSLKDSLLSGVSLYVAENY